MAATGHYLGVLKALYDYSADSEDEISVKEDQILFLIERTDDEYVDEHSLHSIKEVRSADVL